MGAASDDSAICADVSQRNVFFEFCRVCCYERNVFPVVLDVQLHATWRQLRDHPA